ncbi:MAG: polymer-forming cytoskeletal protein [Phaeodactylibacter sp.]|nr:polymer-forming cytoskeletal protein [Phaeodactylibacter sp.]
MTVSKARKPQSTSSSAATSASNGAAPQNKFTCVVSKDTTIEGTFGADQDVRLDGTVKGDVKCAKRLVMGQTGKVEGTVVAENAVIMGTIEGEVTINGVLHLHPTAVIKGNIKAKTLKVDEGAQYTGTCSVGGGN